MIAVAACGGDDDAPAGERPRGTTAPVATSAPPMAPPATTVPTVAPAVATQAPAATTVPASGGTGSSGGDAASIERGQSVFSLAGCTACHTIEGVPGAVGVLGPELTHIATVGATRRSGLSAEEYIRESINEPPAFVVDGFPPVMPPTIRAAITDDAMEDLVAFLLTLN